MKKQLIDEEELKRLFNASPPDTLPDNFSDRVMETVLSEQYQPGNLTLPLAPPSKYVAYGICALLTLLLIAYLLLEHDSSASFTFSFAGKDIVNNAHIYLEHPVFAIASVTLGMATWILIYIHTRVLPALPWQGK